VFVAAEILRIHDFDCHIGKAAAPHIAEQRRLLEMVGDIQIGLPIAVEVSPGRAVGHAHVLPQTGFFRYIFKQSDFNVLPHARACQAHPQNQYAQCRQSARAWQRELSQ